jgi:hypothetical protein
MIFEPKNPVPCVTPLGDAYIFYIKTNGFLENDEVACILVKDGSLKHFTTDQIKIWHNQTYKIEKNEQKVS